MAKLQLIQNQDGDVAIVRKVFGFIRLYRLVSFCEWSVFPSWYPNYLASHIAEKFEELCKNPRQTRTNKFETVIAEFEF